MKPLNIKKESCSPISSNCIIWNGPDIDCIGLCKGDSVTHVVYKLGLELCKIMDKFNVSNYDISCLNLPCVPESFEDMLNSIIAILCEGGIQGEKGAQGEKGETGNQGAQGPQGIPGPPGEKGLTGPEGPQGVQGVQGPAGTTGPQGPVGENGSDGENGEDGENGKHGRGVAVFVQETEPTQNDFDAAYTGVPGFTINAFDGADTFKPGDLWIGNCLE